MKAKWRAAGKKAGKTRRTGRSAGARFAAAAHKPGVRRRRRHGLRRREPGRRSRAAARGLRTWNRREEKAVNGELRNDSAAYGTAAEQTAGDTAAAEAEAGLPEPQPLAGDALEQALADSFEAGYQSGCYEGGEAIVARLIPPNLILPGYTVTDLIAAGLRHLPPGAMVRVMSAAEVAAALGAALDAGLPLSIVRVGDGELLTLAHDAILPTEEAQRRGPFLPYAGVELPAPEVRVALASALRKADIIGVPQSRHPSFQGLLFPVFSHYGFDLKAMKLTFSTINYVLAEQGLLLPLLRGRRVLVCGNKAEGLAYTLQRNGIEVAGIISPVQGVQDAENAVLAASGYSFDIALVSAGVAAVIICTEIAARLGKPALDFGHMANKLESGEMELR